MEGANAVGVAGVPASALNRIDLSSPDIRHSVALLKQACLDSGFFYVINHGIGQDLMEEVFVQSRRFFGLPLSEKMKLLRNKNYRGYTPLFDEVLDAGNQIRGDYKEGFYLGVEVPEDDPDAQRPHFGPNLWPSEDILPRWRQTMEKFHSQALNVAKALARIIALALDLEADYFDRPEILGKPIPVLRLLHYEGLISDPSKGIYGAGAHSDFGFITLLATDDVPGLQICKNKDAKPQTWEYVQPLKGSTLHRVIGNGQERYSIALFLEPNHDCLVECLPTCMSEENPPKFPPILCHTYLAQRYGDTHADLDVYRREGA
ncbi:hypothetical protein BT93_C2068 [Corymbia citriodora subsp. variegata]|nr:hypothetical protein BT93_C2068 [Corymbia citriodora subsp. variegata]